MQHPPITMEATPPPLPPPLTLPYVKQENRNLAKIITTAQIAVKQENRNLAQIAQSEPKIPHQIFPLYGMYYVLC